ncbi:hypothetical protein [Halobacteriovorax sp. JY17]|uniref:hypothetical protein n=1 Tax=Halobacteriovorax sp. JY17 TaxID=2014617 RepID=UPI000C696B1C|nr:hypothetical protein [Halobacteriovorax sp. JY17]PIK14301.1 MAG: hypothetical protein CES88_15105 [Halobacteriovorax sp. JY17]
MNKIILILFIAFASMSVNASQSMRKCMLLPVKDSIGGALGFKVYEEVERYLKTSEWCYYRSNSEIINILGNYKRNLDEHLHNEDVLKVVAEKTKAGSLIRIELISEDNGVEVEMNIIGDNGKDVYFKEKLRLSNNDPVVIGQTVKNWLDQYEKNIPYDGRILGILGNQFTVDFGKSYGVFINDSVEIIRPIKKKRHPLFKEIVDWETEKLSNGRIFYVSPTQAQGKIDKYESRKRVEIDDWVILKKDANAQKADLLKIPYEQAGGKDDFSFGKLGTIGIFGVLNSSKVSSTTGAVTNSLSGLLMGVNIEAELWATRNYWGSFELGSNFGSQKKKSGNLSVDSNSTTNSKFKLKFGYRYLPLGFFFGPQVDAYVGYAKYTYGHDDLSANKIGEVSFSGVILGGKGSIPLMKKFRAHIRLEFMLTSSYSEDVFLYGKDDSSSNYNIEIGGSHNYSPNMEIEGGLEFNSNKAKFTGGQSMSLKDTAFKGGVRFNF